MQSVMVVEDEKLIRQGIATMIKRCGVPVKEIIECANGLKAMEVLATSNVDVVFTDIRMPKMNGIELVKAMQELDNPPLTIAVSGYDDFSYAVEMMRQGVKEYILKPVERAKLKEVMEKLEKEICRKRDAELENASIGEKMLKYTLTDDNDAEEDNDILEKKIRLEAGEDYCVIVAPRGDDISEDSWNPSSAYEIDGMNVFIISGERADEIKKRITAEDGFLSAAGLSDIYKDVKQIKKAYLQALGRRKAAFFRGKAVFDEKDIRNIPDELLDNGRKLCEKSALSTRIQLIGTDKTDKLEKEWCSFFTAVGRCQIRFEDFEETMKATFEQFSSVYRQELPEAVKKPLCYNTISEYKDAFMDIVFEANAGLIERTNDGLVESKLQKAIAYIKENYTATNINMAVVSNYVSMNYYFFSTAFKNYTGTNFVSYVKELRIEEAKRLLEKTTLKINEIGVRVGYDNDKHFLKNFKAAVGVSPREYRRNITGE